MRKFPRKISCIKGIYRRSHGEIPCAIKETSRNIWVAIGKFPKPKKYLECLALSCDKFKSVIFIAM